MKVKLAAMLLALSVSASVADTTNCENLYVGRIWVEKGVGLRAAVFLNHPDNSSGSYWTYFSDWPAEDKKAALSLLTAAKIAKHRVNVATEEADGCGIQTGYRNAKDLFLANNP